MGLMKYFGVKKVVLFENIVGGFRRIPGALAELPEIRFDSHLLFAHFVIGSFSNSVVILVGRLQYATGRRKKPLQNALLFCITGSYPRGTLSRSFAKA